MSKSQKSAYKLASALKVITLADFSSRNIPQSTVNALHSKGLLRKVGDVYHCVNIRGL